MDRTTALWTLVAFFGAGLIFAVIRRALEGESVALSLGAQVAAGVVVIAVAALLLRRRG